VELQKIGFIGCGNMGGALLRSVVDNRVFAPSRVYASDVRKEQLERFGDIDINSSPDMKKVFEKVFKDKMPKVVINFENIGYVDSSGLATIVEIFKNMKAYGGKLKLAGLSDKVMGLFEITKLDQLFDISQNADEAVNSF